MSPETSHEAPAAPSLEFLDWGYRHSSRLDFAVRKLNLSIRGGERVLLLGASGVGKSTILAGAAGLLGSQDINVADTAAAGADTSAADIGGIEEGRIVRVGEAALMLQDPESQMILARVGDNVAFGLENIGTPARDIWQVVSKSLDAVGLGGIQLYRSTEHLSGGQQQRLALAGAIAMQPSLLLLDEPTANLDSAGASQVVEAIGSVVDATHSTLLVVEHRPDRWLDIIDRVVVLARVREEDGEGVGCATAIVADGSPDDVFTDTSIDFDALGVWVPGQYRRTGHQHADSGFPHHGREPRTESPALLSTHELAIGRGDERIAENINLEFRAGEAYAIVGLNGAGKSTLALNLCGLLAPLDGKVCASDELRGDAKGDEPIAWKSGELAARISYVFQNPEHQFVRAKVIDEIELALLKRRGEMRRTDNGQQSDSALELLSLFGLARYASANPYTLSGGEKRRLSVATALAAHPRIIVLDEPTFGQDRTTWQQMVELMRDMVAQGICIVVVTHDGELVEALGAHEIYIAAYEMVSDNTFDFAADIASGAASRADAVAPSLSSSLSSFANPRSVSIRVTSPADRVEPPKQSSRSQLIAALNPVFRLMSGVLVGLPLLASLNSLSAGIVLAVEILFFMVVGISLWRLIRSTWPVLLGAPFSGLTVLFYGHSGGRVLLDWGMVHVTELSAQLALATTLRVCAMGIPAVVMVLGIDPTDLADALSQVLHLPDRFVYGGLAGMRLFSVIRDDWSALTMSRRTRGIGEANKFLNFFPQAFALLVLAIRRSTALAVSMQARGFDGTVPRTHARVSTVRARDWVFLCCSLALPVAALLVFFTRAHA